MTEPYRIRNVQTWAQARDDYLSGLSAEAVCRRHDLGLSAFRRRAREYGWRRLDQPDPSPADQMPDLDLSIYEDIRSDDQVETARLRFVQALERGRAVEAVRWRRLWHALRSEAQAFDADFFAGMSPEKRAAFRAAAVEDPDAEADALLLAMR